MICKDPLYLNISSQPPIFKRSLIIADATAPAVPVEPLPVAPSPPPPAPTPVIEVPPSPPPVLDYNLLQREEHSSDDCAITFDDGPGNHTGQLLDLLADRQIKATFFVLGIHVRQHPDIIRRLIAEGHAIGSHSYDHPDMRHLDDLQRRQQLRATNKLLSDLGVKPLFFRPPYGGYDEALVQEAYREGMQVILWSHDSQDWHYHSLPTIEGKLLTPPGKNPHGVFLFHDVHDTTIAAMPAILDELRTRGCHFVTMNEWTEHHLSP